MFRENYPIVDQPLIDINTSLACKSCGLFNNQHPLLDNQKKSDVFWVGLSAVKIMGEDLKQPLSASTRTGALIEEIEKPFLNNVAFYRTNIVKCLPLKDEKIRYPNKCEMGKCYPYLQLEIDKYKPTLIFLLGKQVINFVLSKQQIGDIQLNNNFNYDSVLINNIRYIPVHHPSYILVYKRKFTENYIEGIRAFLDKIQESQFPKHIELSRKKLNTNPNCNFHKTLNLLNPIYS